MKIIAFAATLVLGASVAHQGQPEPRPIRLAQSVMCFKSGEDAPVGFTKICYYDCLGSRVAITISSVALCPLTIQR